MLQSEKQSWGCPCYCMFFVNEAYRVKDVVTI